MLLNRQEDELVGDLAVYFAGQDQVEIGFTVAPQYQHQNIASEAVSRLLGYLFSDLCKQRVVATTDARNTAANRLLDKLGFRRKKQLTQRVFFKGEWAEEYRWVRFSGYSR
jgi:RimJ/RimL family protein N-acetyltransferase